MAAPRAKVRSSATDLPVLSAFRMMAKMSGQRLPVESSGDIRVETITRDGVRGAPDVAAIASLAAGKLAVLL